MLHEYLIKIVLIHTRGIIILCICIRNQGEKVIADNEEIAFPYFYKKSPRDIFRGFLR